MIIIPEALELAKLQRTSATEEQIIDFYHEDFKHILQNTEITQVEKYLDIGCGIAGPQCFMPKTTKLFLIDKTEVDSKLYYGFQQKTSFYNSMMITKENLIANGVKENNINIQEATETNEIKFNERFDLITSFISCGFHYPIETYLDQIYEKLKTGGVLIVDIRKETTGLAALKTKFGNSEPIKEHTKYWRVKYVK